MTQKNLRLDFLCIGPQRTGTSWLDRALRLHPDICLPKGVKETLFFDERFENGFDWYAWHFQHCSAPQLTGEIAPSYFDSPEACERLSTHSPDSLILAMLRAPLQRTFSLYRHHLSKGRVSGSFSEAIRQMPRIVQSGHYRRHLEMWRGAFGETRVQVLLFDDLENNPQRFVDRCCDILEVERIKLQPELLQPFGSAPSPRFPRLARIAAKTATFLRSHRWHSVVEFGKKVGLQRVYRGGPEPSVIERKQREQIVAIFEDDIAYVEHLLGRKLPEWRNVQAAL